MSARSLLARLARIETSNRSPILQGIGGSIEAFEQNIAGRIAAGKMCPHDGPILAKCVRRWVEDTHHVTYGNTVESFTPQG
jgi:hypothetical protein